MFFKKSNSAEQALRQSIFAVISIDKDNLVTFFNPAAEQLWGYRAQEVLGKNVMMLVPRIHQSQHDEYVNRHRKTGIDKIVGSSREVQIETKAGKSVWVQLALSQVMVGAEKHYTAFVREVTKEREAREFTVQTLEQALDAVVCIDENNNVTLFNKAAENLWGYERDTVLGQNVKMLVPKAIQPQHDDYVNNNRATGQDKIVGTSREIKIERSNGETLWGQLSLSKIVLEGRMLYTAFVRDVTEEVEQREQRRMLALVANETDNAVIITDNQGRIEYVNNGFSKLTGWHLDEVRGRKPGSFLQGKATDKETIATIRKRIHEREPFYDEILNYRKDGTPYWTSLSINPVFHQGVLVNFIAVQADVTAVKQMALEFTQKLEAIGSAIVLMEFSPHGTIISTNALLKDALANKVSETQFCELVYRSLDQNDRTALAQHSFVSKIIEIGEAESYLAFDARICELRDVDGKPERYVFFGLNVTQRKLVVNKTQEAMESLLSTSQTISNIVGSINSISDQTNLLALNAAIEAARAGELGRGFAVVADEVRSLAGSSRESSSQIEDLIKTTVAKIDELATLIQKIDS